jgi:hypothetical protein
MVPLIWESQESVSRRVGIRRNRASRNLRQRCLIISALHRGAHWLSRARSFRLARPSPRLTFAPSGATANCGPAGPPSSLGSATAKRAHRSALRRGRTLSSSCSRRRPARRSGSASAYIHAVPLWQGAALVRVSAVREAERPVVRGHGRRVLVQEMLLPSLCGAVRIARHAWA